MAFTAGVARACHLTLVSAVDSMTAVSMVAEDFTVAVAVSTAIIDF